MSDSLSTRREALAALAARIAGGMRPAPLHELVLVREFAAGARLILPPAAYAAIARRDRGAFDRVTLRPRMLRPTLDLDLGVALFGEALDSPLIVGASADQGRFHAQAELATARGAAKAGAPVVVSSDSSVPLEKIAAEARTPLWLHAPVGPGAGARMELAARAGFRAVILAASQPVDWEAVGRLRRGTNLPVLMDGILAPEEAAEAVRLGISGLIVSGPTESDGTHPLLALPAVVEAAGRVPVLIGADFELGVDILKSLAYGASAVLVGRPVMWGLAAYGQDGVETVLQMLKQELARAMAMCGCPRPGDVGRGLVRLHG